MFIRIIIQKLKIFINLSILLFLHCLCQLKFITLVNYLVFLVAIFFINIIFNYKYVLNIIMFLLTLILMQNKNF